MWSYFSRDPLSGFAYDFQNENTFLAEKSIWKVFEGKKKTTGAVSLFYSDLKALPPEKSEQVKSCFRSFKTLRHPNLLGFIDGIESNEKICVVTERISPLSQHAMNNTLTLDQVTLGLYQICQALEFLIQRCGFIHNNVNWHSVFVTQSGEWKLGGFEYLVKKEQEGFPSKLSSLQIYDPPERSRGGSNKRAVHATDSWGLGCLLWEVYNGPLPRPQAVKQSGNVPESLVGVLSSLVNTNQSSRLPPWQVVEQGMLPGGCMTNLLVKSNIFLDEIQIKNSEEKRYFFQSLHERLDSFPKNYAIYKLLPILLDAVSSNLAFGAIILPSLMKLGEYVESSQYESDIVPVVVKLFSSPDRQTRMSLLTKIDCYIEHIKPSTVNNDIYPNLIQGFLDTNPSLREQTVKSMLFVAPKLNSKNLNDDLMRHFARIQSKDEQPGIRTNTTVCIGKLACYMDSATRQKVLPAACTKAMRDPFAQSRMAGILAILANIKYFSVRDTASKCLPAICPLTVDPDKQVRDQAFKAVSSLLKRLQDAHDNPERIPEMESEMNKTVSHTSSKHILNTFTGWVLSNWGSSSNAGASGATSDNMGPSAKASEPEKSIEETTHIANSNSNIRSPKQSLKKEVVPAPKLARDREADRDPRRDTSAWSDDDLGSEASDTSNFMEPTKNNLRDEFSSSTATTGWGDEEGIADDDTWEDLPQGKHTPAHSAFKTSFDTPPPAQNYNSDEFFQHIITPVNKSQAVKKSGNDSPKGLQLSKKSTAKNENLPSVRLSDAKPAQSTDKKSASQPEGSGWDAWGEW